MVVRTLVASLVLASGTTGIAQVTPWAPPAHSGAAQQRGNIICGTRVFRADPTIDPKIIKPAPEGRFTLRTLQPPVCGGALPTPGTELKQRLPQFFGPKR